LAADKVDVANSFKLLVIGYRGRAVAEADFDPQVEYRVPTRSGVLSILSPKATDVSHVIYRRRTCRAVEHG
jgi:hypothetical protein